MTIKDIKALAAFTDILVVLIKKFIIPSYRNINMGLEIAQKNRKNIK